MPPHPPCAVLVDQVMHLFVPTVNVHPFTGALRVRPETARAGDLRGGRHLVSMDDDPGKDVSRGEVIMVAKQVLPDPPQRVPREPLVLIALRVHSHELIQVLLLEGLIGMMES